MALKALTAGVFTFEMPLKKWSELFVSLLDVTGGREVACVTEEHSLKSVTLRDSPQIALPFCVFKLIR